MFGMERKESGCWGVGIWGKDIDIWCRRFERLISQPVSLSADSLDLVTIRIVGPVQELTAISHHGVAMLGILQYTAWGLSETT